MEQKNTALGPDKFKELLESNWSKLIDHLEVDRIIPRFQDARIFDVMDRERITNASRYPTSADRAGNLLDTVLRRGPQAIELLFNQVEEHYPDLYKEITGREPKITRRRMLTIVKRHEKGVLPPGLTLNILTQLTEMVGVKEKQEEELGIRNRELEAQRLVIEKLKQSKKRMLMKNKALLSKTEERDKLQTELTQRTTMLKDVQNKLLKFQREADKAKHHARMATFKNFHLEYEVREMHNKMNLQRRQTRNLQKSVKDHEKWLTEHNISYAFDHEKVEELQRELEKIDDYRRSVAISDEVCEISERVQSQLAKARETNEGLNLKLQRVQERNDGLKGEIDLLKKERKMMKETMRMNRLHLEMSQQELEIVSRERAKLNQAYVEVLKDMSQSFLTTTSLQDRLNRLRLDYANLSQRVMNADDGSVDTSGIYPHGDADDELVDDDDDTAADVEDNSESGLDDASHTGEVIFPMPRERLKRLVSTSSSPGHRKSEQMKALSESFDRGESSYSPPCTMTSSSSTTTGDEAATTSLDIGRISGFPSYGYQGNSDEDDDDDDDDDDDIPHRPEDDFEILDPQPVSVRSRPGTRHHIGMQDRRRSRSLSRLEDYENMEFLKNPGCYSFMTNNSWKDRVYNLFNR